MLDKFDEKNVYSCGDYYYYKIGGMYKLGDKTANGYRLNVSVKGRDSSILFHSLNEIVAYCNGRYILSDNVRAVVCDTLQEANRYKNNYLKY